MNICIRTGRRDRQPIRASARLAMVRSRWSLNFVKERTIFGIGNTVAISCILASIGCRVVGAEEVNKRDCFPVASQLSPVPSGHGWLGQKEPLDKPRPFATARLKPFWRSDIMDGESVLFIKEGKNEQPKADLLFVPTKILLVCSSSGDVVYKEGTDYVWDPGTREITLSKNSRIPFKTPQDLRRSNGSQQYGLTHRDGKGEILFGGGHEYHDMQAVVTYQHKPDAWSEKVPLYAGDQLPRTIEKLQEKQPLTIAVFGDSISTGCNASGWAKTAPFQPAYYDLLALNLEKTYGGKVTTKNFAVGGVDSPWGVANIQKVIDAKPDLVILAFGMNDDPAGRSAESYQANIKAMVDAVRKANPQTEFILVASMLGNPDWTLIHPELFPQYRDALAELCGSGVALADLTSIWTWLLKHKRYWDLTGNGVNHPNDFGHRVYAEVLSTLLIDSSMPASL